MPHIIAKEKFFVKGSAIIRQANLRIFAMLEKISIKNFQSHKATSMELSPLVNTLQGNSDCGKSAVMRAVCWLLFNPAGDYFVSDWAKKGKTISAPCEVSVVANGHTITRRRDKDFNGYTLDGQVFEATRNSVPPQILEALGLGEVNVQRQLDAPFLLSMSAGDVSRYINSLVNLTRIDKWTVSVNGRGRKLQQDADAAQAREEKARAEVESFAYLERLEELSAEITALEVVQCEKLEEDAELEASVARYEAEVAAVAALPNVDKVFVLLNKASDAACGAERLGTMVSELGWQVERHGETQAAIAALPNIERAQEVLKEAQEIAARREQVEGKLVALSADINRRLSVKVPEVPESLFDGLAELGRCKGVLQNMDARVHALQNELANHEKATVWASEAGAELEPILRQLDGMVCPMCGRSGVHTHQEEK